MKKCHISLLSPSGSDVLLFREKLIYILIHFLCKLIAKKHWGSHSTVCWPYCTIFIGLIRKKILICCHMYCLYWSAHQLTKFFYIFPINSKEHSALKDNVQLICFWFFSRVLNSRLNCLSWKINHALQESLLNKIVFLPRDSKNLSYTICGSSYRKMFFCIIRGHQVAFVRYNHINTILIYGFAMLWASTTYLKEITIMK